MSGFVWATIAALIWGVVPLFEKLGLSRVSPLVGLFYRCVGVILGMILLSVFMVKPQEIKAVDVRSALFLILAGFFASFIAQICFYHGLKLGDISRIVPISASYPFITFLIGVAVLGEGINGYKIVGVLLVLLGVWFLKIA